MYSALNCNFSALSICKFKNNFINKYASVKHGQLIPKSATTFTNAAKQFSLTVMKWTREAARPFKVRKKSYSIQIDAASDTKSEAFAPMVSFGAKMKPLLMDIKFHSTNANQIAITKIVNQERERWGLHPDLYRYQISM